MKRVNIYGGGPTALIIAHQLYTLQGVEIHLYERNSRTGRKFLVAGKGGFNLTNSKKMNAFIQQYSPGNFMNSVLKDFNNLDLQCWLKDLGIDTYTGSSGRVFPVKDIRPIQVLQAILKPLEDRLIFHYKALFSEWDNAGIQVLMDDKLVRCEADFHIFCLGGASWSKTGSDGSWAKIFDRKGIKVHPFAPSNCGLEINWSDEIKSNHSGKALKNIAVSFNGKQYKGEATISDYGLEGNAIYPMASSIQKHISQYSEAILKIDFKTQSTVETLLNKLALAKGNRTAQLIKLGLNRTTTSIIKNLLSKDEWLDDEKLVKTIKAAPIQVKKVRSIEESISTTGGVDVHELDENFELLKFKNHFCGGEMVNWDTITGGFLLQACFSMGFRIGQHIKSQLEEKSNL